MPSTQVLLLALSLAAALVAAYQLSRPGMLFGPTADIAVYFGAAVRLVHGFLPYRDFVLVQPPGIVFLTTPFALLSELVGTRTALACLRLTTPALAAADVYLVGRLVRHRGPLPVVVSAALLAFFPAQLYALGSVLLEPLLTLFCLLGASLVFAGDGIASIRRVLLGGIAFGFAIALKAPAVLPLLVVLVLLLPDRRRLLRFAGGAAIGVGIPCLAFVAAAPAAFVQDVVGSQLGRVVAAGRTPALVRLNEVMGVAFGPAVIGVAILAVLAVLLVAGWRSSHRLSPLERFALGSAVLVLLFQFVPQTYYPHYAAFVAPFLATLAALAVSRLGDAARWEWAVPATVVGVGVLVTQAIAYVHSQAVVDTGPQIQALVPAGACTLSDTPRLLITADRFVSSSPGCPPIVDPFGTMLAEGTDATAPGVWTGILSRVEVIVTQTPFEAWYIRPDAALNRYVTDHFELRKTGGFLIYDRR